MKNRPTEDQNETQKRVSSLLTELDRPLSTEEIERALARVKQKAIVRRPAARVATR